MSSDSKGQPCWENLRQAAGNFKKTWGEPGKLVDALEGLGLKIVRMDETAVTDKI